MRIPVIILFCFIAFFGRGQNSARLFCPEGQLFTVKLGSTVVNSRPQAEVLVAKTINDTLLIHLESSEHAPSTATLYLTDKGKKTYGKEFDYVVDFSRSPARVVYTGMCEQLRLPDPLVPLKPAEDTSYKYNNNLLGHFCELRNGKPEYFNNRPVHGACKEPMPTVYMSYAAQLMARTQSDDGRYDVVENICRNNCLSVDQLSRLLNYVNFEVEKLKLVKQAYFNLVDTGNCYRLETSFHFGSSAHELNHFLKNTGNYRLQFADHCVAPADSLSIHGFQELLTMSENDAQRYEIFKVQYSRYCYSVAQVRSILTKFIHDREKLNAAKQLYFYCTQQEKFESLVDVLSYNESINELKNFISKQVRK